MIADVRYCWFHDREHSYDGMSDGWMCHAYGPVAREDGTLRVEPEGQEDYDNARR